MTGSQNYFDGRSALKEIIEQKGGKVTGSVTGKTTCNITKKRFVWHIHTSGGTFGFFRGGESARCMPIRVYTNVAKGISYICHIEKKEKKMSDHKEIFKNLCRCTEDGTVYYRPYEYGRIVETKPFDEALKEFEDDIKKMEDFFISYDVNPDYAVEATCKIWRTHLVFF